MSSLHLLWTTDGKVVSAKDKITIKEIREYYKDKEKLEEFIQSIEEDPDIAYIDIDGKVFIYNIFIICNIYIILYPKWKSLYFG